MNRRTMRRSEFPSNNKTVPNTRLNTPLGTGRKISPGRKASGLANDVRNMGNNLFTDMVLPALQNIFVDFLSQFFGQFANGLGSFIFGNNTEPYRRTYDRRTNYNSQYSYKRRGQVSRSRVPIREAYPEPRRRGGFAFSDVYFDIYREAEIVLAKLQEYVIDYGSATVMDYYSLSAVDYDQRVDELYGWTNLDRIRIGETADGYIIELPEPIYLNR